MNKESIIPFTFPIFFLLRTWKNLQKETSEDSKGLQETDVDRFIEYILTNSSLSRSASTDVKNQILKEVMSGGIEENRDYHDA